MAVDNALNGCQPNAGSFKFRRAMKTLERREELVGKFHVEACAIILDKVVKRAIFW
jgi:hypothetical protein